ncbi:SpoIIE family protein phosphatase [Zavarzinella formosa]|uniref:SpoIIE family protein phosphatase n=1 Tax=Zavarzinella formosa TaxID=360055 RepID=UPI000308CF2D|nr:SpoIIE family protein phosphatase [Zavarzinella formosa]
MPSLILTKTPDGSAAGDKHPLDKDPTLIGRSPEKCKVVLPANAVSREHARIIHTNGQFYIEDLGSRNSTFLNNKKVEGRWNTPLKHGDNIKICDFLFSFRDENYKGSGGLDDLLGPKTSQPEEEPEEDPNSHTTVEATFQRIPVQQFLDSQPSEKLRAVLDISTALSKTLDIEALMPQIADELFKVFKQADRCFIIELGENDKLIPKVVKSRRPSASEQFSRTIVRKCLSTLESYLSEDASSDASMGLAQSIADFKIRSVMCVALSSQDGRGLGVIQLDSQDRTKKFTKDDLKLLICVAAQASIALENARLHATVLKQQKLEEENKAATTVQKGFLPQAFPLLPGYEFFSFYLAARTVGGDYYDFITLPNGKQAVLLGDVSGKGVPAALLMARLSGEARVSMLTQAGVARAITHLNEQLMQANLHDRYVTLSAAIIDPKTHEVELVNAGHLSPFIYRSATNKFVKVFEKDSGDFPIGWVPGHEYSAHKVRLEPGDSLIVYTDGIEDAQPNTGQRFLEEGVVRTVEHAIRVGQSMSARDLGTVVVEAVKRHVGTHPQFDDIALVCYGRLPQETDDSHIPTGHGEITLER